MKKAFIFITLATTFCLVGCTVTRDFYFASLEDLDGVQVLSRNKLEVINLEKNSVIPTNYSLSREKYSLNFSIGTGYLPNFLISVSAPDIKDIQLRHRETEGIPSPVGRGLYCASYRVENLNSSEIFFAWSRACFDDEYEKFMYFYVLDAAEEIIGREDIPFSIIKDGKYWNYDGP